MGQRAFEAARRKRFSIPTNSDVDGASPFDIRVCWVLDELLTLQYAPAASCGQRMGAAVSS